MNVCMLNNKPTHSIKQSPEKITVGCAQPRQEIPRRDANSLGPVLKLVTFLHQQLWILKHADYTRYGS
jgi:hypothetical protein